MHFYFLEENLHFSIDPYFNLNEFLLINRKTNEYLELKKFKTKHYCLKRYLK